jgi:hypothetical protein
VERAHSYARRPIQPVRHVTLPFATSAQVQPEPGETIATFLERTGWASRVGKLFAFALPTICVVNGQPLLQRQWKRRRIKPGDAVEFWSRPWGKAGGTGKQILGIVALIAVAAFAAWASPLLAGALVPGVAGASSIIGGAIIMGGALYIGGPLVAPKLRGGGSYECG